MKIRVALCGASGTGKTTVVRRVAEMLHLPINPVGSRSVAKEMGFNSPYDVDRAGQRSEFQRLLTRQKAAWEVDNDTFITDRTSFDNLVYHMLHDIQNVTPDDIQLASFAFERYTHVFFCPMRAFLKLGDDPHRLSSLPYHEAFERLLLSFVDDRAITLNEGRTELRIGIVEATCRSALLT